VVQGEYTTIYYANDYGDYVIPLEKDVENVNLTLQSDMLTAQTTYTFVATLYASATEAGTAYQNALNVGQAYTIAEDGLLSTLRFTSPVATVLPSVKVTAENRLCEVGGSLNVVITAEDMEGYQIVGTVYLKSDDANGTYNSTAQKFIINADGTATEVTEEIEEGQPSAADLDDEVEQTSPYSWTLEYAIGLSGQKSGTSFCVIFAVIDTETGLTLYEIPLYFIIYSM
jgi:hypothetical protein